ncbi:ChbG/HpnK family deacetylase [Actinotignum sp. GS-2025c]|uniref:ChbG/HpnK family deacetylase n=1 Tax=Actinotignum sp. GS-2025c TaxID=3427276 RepID=UPI003F447A15
MDIFGDMIAPQPSSSARTVAVCADGLGRNRALNNLIIEMLERGHATCATLLVAAPAADHALRALAAVGIDPGRILLGFAISSQGPGAPWRAVGPHASSLTDRGGRYLSAEESAAPPQLVREDILTELAAQFSWMEDRGYRPAGIAGPRYGRDFRGRGLVIDCALEFCARVGVPLRYARRGDPLVAASRYLAELGAKLGEGAARHANSGTDADVVAAHARRVERADALGVLLPNDVVFFPPEFPAESYGELRHVYLSALEECAGPAIQVVFTSAREDSGAGRGEWETRLMRDPSFLRAVARARCADAQGISTVPAGSKATLKFVEGKPVAASDTGFDDDVMYNVIDDMRK